MNHTIATSKEASPKARGIFAAITTPFTDDLKTDEAGLRHNMHHMTQTLHVDGVFCTGVMGEFWLHAKALGEIDEVIQPARREDA